MIRAKCPQCGHACEFADYLGGLTLVCRNCGHRIPVPAREPQASTSSDPPAVLSQVTPSDDQAASSQTQHSANADLAVPEVARPMSFPTGSPNYEADSTSRHHWSGEQSQRTMRWSIAIPVVVGVHAFASGFVILFAFGIGMMYGEQHPLWWLALGLFMFFFYPLILLNKLGLQFGPIDSGVGMLFNSLCWSLIMCSLWQVTRTWRRAIVRRASVPWCRFLIRVVGTLGLGNTSFQ